MKKIFYFILILILSLNTSLKSYANEEYLSAKIIALDSEKKIEDEDGLEKILKYKVKILEGEDRGREIVVDFPRYIKKEYNLNVNVGDKVVLYRSYDEKINEEKVEKIERTDISDVDKRSSFYLLGIIFTVLVFLIARKKGLKSSFALVITVVFILRVFVPSISRGYSPILMAVITCIFSTTVTIIFITGFTRKSFVGILGTISGVVLSGIISYFFVNKMELTGYSDPEILSYANIIENINLKELISAGVIIGSLGAVMDVAVSISSSLNELSHNNPEISEKKLFKSAMNIGNDIIGTMVNTLILAYIGSFLLMIVLLYLQSGDYPLIRIINYENIAEEILRAVCGSIGILISVPLTSFIGSKIYKKHFSAFK